MMPANKQVVFQLGHSAVGFLTSSSRTSMDIRKNLPGMEALGLILKPKELRLGTKAWSISTNLVNIQRQQDVCVDLMYTCLS